jgi:hypothetical protein
VCFICLRSDHIVEDCSEWQSANQSAQYLGIANRGLGFYHIDVAPKEGRFRHWAGLDNYGVFTVEGDIDEQGILDNLRNLFDQNWDWQLKTIDDFSYLVRFPPSKKVESFVISKISYFYLNKDGVMASPSLKAWNGDTAAIGKVDDVWVQIKGIPPKWVDWLTIKEIASTLGRLVEVDWHSLFNSFFSMVRIRIKCKNPGRILREIIVEMEDKLFLIQFKAEGWQEKQPSSDLEDQNEGGFDSDEDLLDDVGIRTPNPNGGWAIY